MRTTLVILVSVALAGCSLTRHPEKSRPGRNTEAIPSGSNVPSPPPDVLAIPDAVPRAEPRGTRGNPPFYEVFGKRYYVMASSDGWVERGRASWYGPGFDAASASASATSFCRRATATSSAASRRGTDPIFTSR